MHELPVLNCSSITNLKVYCRTALFLSQYYVSSSSTEKTDGFRVLSKPVPSFCSLYTMMDGTYECFDWLKVKALIVIYKKGKKFPICEVLSE